MPGLGFLLDRIEVMLWRAEPAELTALSEHDEKKLCTVLPLKTSVQQAPWCRAAAEHVSSPFRPQDVSTTSTPGRGFPALPKQGLWLELSNAVGTLQSILLASLSVASTHTQRAR